MYTLYHDKKGAIIEVKKAVKAMANCNFTDEVVSYNNCYYICAKKKPLVEMAEKLKKSWEKEAEERLEKIKAIKI